MADEAEFFFGADNLLDNKPPFIVQELQDDSPGIDTPAGIYDVLGRRFYAGFRAKF